MHAEDLQTSPYNLLCCPDDVFLQFFNGNLHFVRKRAIIRYCSKKAGASTGEVSSSCTRNASGDEFPEHFRILLTYRLRLLSEKIHTKIYTV